jgi:hypothetical protein
MLEREDQLAVLEARQGVLSPPPSPCNSLQVKYAFSFWFICEQHIEEHLAENEHREHDPKKVMKPIVVED